MKINDNKKNHEQDKGGDATKRATGRGLKDVYSSRLKAFEKMKVKSFAVLVFINNRFHYKRLINVISNIHFLC